jgi:hypothetical protein
MREDEKSLKMGAKQKAILQQQDFSIWYETSNFLREMKSFWKYEKYDKQIGIFIYFTRRLYNKKILRKMIITFTFRSLVHDFQFCCGDILMFKLKAWRRGARYIPLIVIVN